MLKFRDTMCCQRDVFVVTSRHTDASGETEKSGAKCRGSWVVGRGRGSWVWFVGVGVGVGKCRG